jgi:K(+)-stimulated pyrophosphate-energized sodium pump
MIILGLLAIAAPVAVGLLFDPVLLGTLLIGATAYSVMVGFFFNNSGALFDNSKKLNENGLCVTKGSESHKASVVGDTVCDALKDVAGPSVLIFMKLLGMIALLLLPVLLHI